MNRAIFAAALAAAPTIAAAGVHGSIIMPMNAEVFIEFVSREANFDGELSLVMPDLSQPQFIADNIVRDDARRSVSLGTFEEGEALVLQYEIVRGRIPATFISSDDDDALQFLTTFVAADQAVLAIEDVRFDDGDRDFNDAVFNIYFRSVDVPAPGVAALAAAGLGLAGVRRRR